MSKATKPITVKDKRNAALISLGAAILWIILWYVFPMEFYSLFFASNIGSNVLLAVLAAIIIVIFNFIFTKTLKADISLPASLVSGIILMVGFIYLYSIFRYTAVYLVIICLLVHAAVFAVIYLRSKPENGKPWEKKLKPVLFGVISAVLSDSLYLLLFTALLNTFRE